MLLFLTLLSLAQAPKLELVLALNTSDRDAAEQKLRADPLESATLLSFAMRAVGPVSLHPLMRERGCHVVFGGSPYTTDPSPGNQATKLLLALAHENAAVRTQLARSPSGLDKLLAVLSVWDDAEGIAALGPQLEVVALNEGERRTLSGLHQCAMMRMRDAPKRMAVLASLSGTAKKRESCVDAKDLAAYGNRPLTLRGWGSSGDEQVHFTLDADGTTVDANEACMFAAAELAQTRDGNGAPFLMAVVKAKAPREREALALLKQNLDRYPKDGRRDALRLLMSRGLELQALSEFSVEERYGNDDLLEASLLAKDPAAVPQLMSKLSCPFSGELVSLLSLLNDKGKAKAEAKRLSEMCPRASGKATLVLLELKDPKWAAALPVIQADPFSKHEFERGLSPKWSPAVKQQVMAVASKDEAFIKWREELVRRLDTTAR